MHTSDRFKRANEVAETIWTLGAERFDVAAIAANFPRDIESLAICGLEIPVVRLPLLSLDAAAHYLCLFTSRTSNPVVPADYRSLYGLLHVGPPENVVFVREDLPPHLVNYVIAHELGHFVGDVLSLQRLWLASMPTWAEAIQQVFTWQTCDPNLALAAAMKGLPAPPITIVGRGSHLNEETTPREILADLVARELMAPWQSVAPLFLANPADLRIRLEQQFGLPRRVAAHYWADVRQCLAPPPDTLERLFGPLLSD